MGVVEIVGVAIPVLALLTWLLVVAVAPRALARSPMTSAGAPLYARLWLFAPLWVPVALVLCALLPGVVETLAQSDHCLAHAVSTHHHHLCVVHPPVASGHPVTWAIPALAGAAMLLLMARQGLRLTREWRLSQTLVALAKPTSLGADVLVLSDDAPVAVTVGWRHPKILLSEGLLAQVSDQTLAVILAHERAHVARGDVRSGLLDRLAATLLPRAVAAPLLARIALGREQACDAIAATQTGGPITVAAALTRVARLGIATPACGVSVAGSSLEARILRLVSPRPPARRLRVLTTLTAALTLVVLSGWPLHDVIGDFVEFLLH